MKDCKFQFELETLLVGGLGVRLFALGVRLASQTLNQRDAGGATPSLWRPVLVLCWFPRRRLEHTLTRTESITQNHGMCSSVATGALGNLNVAGV